jgi:DNA repair protein RadC
MQDNNYRLGHIKRLKQRFSDGKISRGEILELLLSYCIKGRDVKPQSRKLYSMSSGNFKKVFDTAAKAEIPGIGDETRLFFNILKSFMDEYNKDSFLNKKLRMATQRDIVEYFRNSCADMTNEAVYCIFLDAKNRVKSMVKICEGTLTQSLLYPREIIGRAIREGALSFILIHNHPSGDATPSENDRKITKKMVFAVKECDLFLLDHIVIGTEGKGYFSFYEDGIMEKYNNAYKNISCESQNDL